MVIQSEVKKLFDYRDGCLYWKIRMARCIQVGSHAGGLNPNGYRYTRIHYKLYGEHRLIFLYHHGYLPKYIDHIDNNKSNNRIENLRQLTNSRNCQRGKMRGGSSKFRGVCFHTRDEKWMVSIMISSKRKFLGYFLNETEAANAYDKAATEHYGEYAGTNFPIRRRYYDSSE